MNINKQWIERNAGNFKVDTELVEDGMDMKLNISLSDEVKELLRGYSVPTSRRRVEFYCFGKSGERVPIKVIAVNQLRHLTGFEHLFSPTALRTGSCSVPISDIREVTEMCDTVEKIVVELIKLTTSITECTRTVTLTPEVIR